MNAICFTQNPQNLLFAIVVAFSGFKKRLRFHSK